MGPELSVPISALQHWLFCPRQCALIHVERLWSDNALTAEGDVLHARADAGRPESRDGVRILRSVQIAAESEGLHGVADVVEIHRSQPFPVEYKRGRPKAHRADEVQLCAQALCLEEMTGMEIREAALFYGRNQRRKLVAIDADLRKLTRDTAKAVRTTMADGHLPLPVFAAKRCNACSLYVRCRPKGMTTIGAGWLETRIAAAGVPE